MMTLTYAVEPRDLDEGWRHIEDFRRRLREAGISQPAIVPEWGTKSGRFHFHAAFREYVPKSTLAELWPHGWVDARVLRTKDTARTTVPKREMARRAAGYLAAYVSKRDAGSQGAAATGSGALARPRRVGFNRKRYSIPQGEQVEAVRFSCVGGLFEAWSEIQRMCGHVLHEVWRSPSGDDEEWRGPPMILLMG